MRNAPLPTAQHPADDIDDAPCLALVLLLRQLAEVIDRLTDQQYGMKPVGVVESSIGGHVRHCLDHVVALLRGAESGCIDYEHRERGTPIERDRGAALSLIADLEKRLTALSVHDLESPVVLEVMFGGTESSRVVSSTLGRELAYVISHTIHHNALVGTMVKLLGGSVPERFGYTPATVAHLQRQRTCAR